MKEVKSPRKPLLYYYGIAMLIIFLFNMLVSPLLMKGQIIEVDYGTFLQMTAEKNIGRVQMDSSEIIFTDKEDTQVYSTGIMYDPALTQRLYDAGAVFAKDIERPTSLLLSRSARQTWKRA